MTYKGESIGISLPDSIDNALLQVLAGRCSLEKVKCYCARGTALLKR